MTLDDLLNERLCDVSFYRKPGNPVSERIECAIAFDREPEPWDSRENTPGVLITSGRVILRANGQSVAQAFTEAIHKMNVYLESVK